MDPTIVAAIITAAAGLLAAIVGWLSRKRPSKPETVVVIPTPDEITRYGKPRMGVKVRLDDIDKASMIRTM